MARAAPPSCSELTQAPWSPASGSWNSKSRSEALVDDGAPLAPDLPLKRGTKDESHNWLHASATKTISPAPLAFDETTSHPSATSSLSNLSATDQSID